MADQERQAASGPLVPKIEQRNDTADEVDERHHADGHQRESMERSENDLTNTDRCARVPFHGRPA